VEINWQQTEQLTSISSTPPINIPSSTANITYTLSLPTDRWTLLAGGPVQGPAVLFWSFAGAILIFSLCLGRLGLTPLKSLSWFLLFLGLSQLNLVSAFLVTGWLLVLGVRERQATIKSTILFNLTQIGLFIWSLLALYNIYKSLQNGLLSAPYMRTEGFGSTDHYLHWFVDRAKNAWPEAWVLTIPERVYRIIMLAWALWLAISIIRWLKWGWHCFSKECYWKKLTFRKNHPVPTQGVPPESSQGRSNQESNNQGSSQEGDPPVAPPGPLETKPIDGN
jgi:hypothetical protein